MRWSKELTHTLDTHRLEWKEENTERRGQTVMLLILCLNMNINLNMNSPFFSTIDSRYFVMKPTACAKSFLSGSSGCVLAKFKGTLTFLPLNSGFYLGTLPRLVFSSPAESRTEMPAECWMLKWRFLLTFCMIIYAYAFFMPWKNKKKTFGKMTSSWKIHYLVQDSLAPQSFWNDFGNISRQTGIIINPLEMVRDCVWSWRHVVLKPVCW